MVPGQAPRPSPALRAGITAMADGLSAQLGTDYWRSADDRRRRAQRALSVFLALVTVAKVARYMAVAAIQQGWS